MPTPAEQIRESYREAVASAIEGKDNLEAWESVRKSLANAIFNAWLSAARNTAIDLPECELTKMLFAKDCGAGAEGSQGFQPGNTCGGEGGGERERVTYDELTEPEHSIVSAIENSNIAEDMVQGLYDSEEEAIDSILSNFEDAVYDEEGNDTINWAEDGEKTINALKDYFYTKTQDYIKEEFGDVDTITMYRGDYSDRHGMYKTPQFVSTDKSTAEFYTTSDLGSHTGRGRKVVEYEVPVEDILMCQECLLGQFNEDAFLVPPEILNSGDEDGKSSHKRTFAKKPDAFDEMFEIFDIEPSFKVGVNQEALDDLAGRVPMVRSAVDYMDSMAQTIAQEVVVAERAGILPFMESTSKGVQAALKNAFWVSDVDHSVVVNIQKLLADAIRGVMPDKALSLPDFISHAKLEGAANLTDSRLETIYRTNISTAANEGVMSILRDPEAKMLFPLVMITEIVDDRTRSHHKAMDGYITTPGEIDRLNLRPPNGYNCRGSLIKITWDEANEMGLLDDAGNPDMISIRRKNPSIQEGLIASGKYPDEGFKRGGFVR